MVKRNGDTISEPPRSIQWIIVYIRRFAYMRGVDRGLPPLPLNVYIFQYNARHPQEPPTDPANGRNRSLTNPRKCLIHNCRTSSLALSMVSFLRDFSSLEGLIPGSVFDCARSCPLQACSRAQSYRPDDAHSCHERIESVITAS